MVKLGDIIAKIRIPKDTCYCYKYLRYIEASEKIPYGGMNIKVCPYWKILKEKDKYGNNICYCKYLKLKSEEYDPLNLIWDMVKECGVNDYE